MVKIQEAENQIITSYEVYEKKPNDSDLLVKAVDEHCERLGQIPDLVTIPPLKKTSLNHFSQISGKQLQKLQNTRNNGEQSSAGTRSNRVQDQDSHSHIGDGTFIRVLPTRAAPCLVRF